MGIRVNCSAIPGTFPIILLLKAGRGHLGLSTSNTQRYRQYSQPLSLWNIQYIEHQKIEKAMGSVFSSRAITKEEMEMALSKAKEIVSSNTVVVFSKTYCGYCKKVKQLMSQLGASYKVIELDVESDGSEIQSALAEWTGQSTVPNVFFGGKHVGGCDVVMAMHQGGKLVPLLTDAGAIGNNSPAVN